MTATNEPRETPVTELRTEAVTVITTAQQAWVDGAGGSVGVTLGEWVADDLAAAGLLTFTRTDTRAGDVRVSPHGWNLAWKHEDPPSPDRPWQVTSMTADSTVDGDLLRAASDAVARCFSADGEVEPTRSREFYNEVAGAVLDAAGLRSSTPNDPTKTVDVVEAVARAMWASVYPNVANPARVFDQLLADGEMPWEAQARAAIRAHYAAHRTPYVDEEHRGGNLLAALFKADAENRRLERRWALREMTRDAEAAIGDTPDRIVDTRPQEGGQRG